MNITDTLWGTGEHLDALQMGVRSFVTFFVSLALLRLGGMRIFGKKSAQDMIITILFGAVLARGVVGASPYWPTVVAAAVMVLGNRVLA
ncbi:hypothetical protein DCC81_18380 [Chitinophaga parva]|uniref:DUF421 domain-containing protein n=1 Tax=Chitinophaga parva TaxID=2169414 RepID=A0A2T7BIT1_9BACT|nr:hypothetical protein [Chitinophaga parva]PUZ26199.1 hypothetical protein DCC81_18380 [Chitinophaga parva]